MDYEVFLFIVYCVAVIYLVHYVLVKKVLCPINVLLGSLKKDIIWPNFNTIYVKIFDNNLCICGLVLNQRHIEIVDEGFHSKLGKVLMIHLSNIQEKIDYTILLSDYKFMYVTNHQFQNYLLIIKLERLGLFFES